MRPGRARALRQFTLSTGKSAGRNSSGRITVFHRGGGSKRLLRKMDLKRSTISMGIFYFFFFIAPKVFRFLLIIRLCLGLLGVLDPALFVIPNLDLPADTEGNEIALNPQPSLWSLYTEMENADSVRARNLLLAESWDRVESLERALENEGDPGRRLELLNRQDRAISELERQIHLGRRADSIRDRQIAEWRGRFNAEFAREGEEEARRTFLNWCLRVLIHAGQEHQPPQK
ncbi:uncharacterized protein LOC112089876 [Eutrema salsugineum]|uniref:uncharacterized protein LOC112089876 n=1 Tax=Eutrema salsugineum TaxID=72664 RepID=UPI000CECE8A0|nr:uncharacterized protein LOC112089876 [Eutrema salsugineum]